MDGKQYDLEDRLVEFAANTIRMSRKFPSDFTGNHLGGQIIRSSSSTALNFGEAQGTSTDKDYISKAAIVLKELKETRVNLKILSKLEYGDKDLREQLLDEAEQLIKIIATIIKNKKSKPY